MENNFGRELTYQEAKSKLVCKLTTIAAIAGFWFCLLRLFLLGDPEVSNWELFVDSLMAAVDCYIPYRVGFAMTGTPMDGLIGALVIMVWVGPWVAEHELLAGLVIIAGYLIDFGPCIYRLMLTWKR